MERCTGDSGLDGGPSLTRQGTIRYGKRLTKRDDSRALSVILITKKPFRIETSKPKPSFTLNSIAAIQAVEEAPGAAPVFFVPILTRHQRSRHC